MKNVAQLGAWPTCSGLVDYDTIESIPRSMACAGRAKLYTCFDHGINHRGLFAASVRRMLIASGPAISNARRCGLTGMASISPAPVGGFCPAAANYVAILHAASPCAT